MNIFNKKNLPNFITAIRIIIVLIMAILGSIIVMSNSKYPIKHNLSNETSYLFLIIIILLVIGYLSDFLDGYLARKWKCVSLFGKIMDPIADKLLAFVMLIILVSFGSINMIVLCLFLLRNWILAGFRIKAAREKKVIAANIYGKITTILIALTLIISSLVILFIPSISSLSLLNSDYYLIINLIFVIPLFFSYFSLFIYLRSFLLKK